MDTPPLLPCRFLGWTCSLGMLTGMLLFSGAPPLAVAQERPPGAAAERGQWTADREGTGGRMQTQQVSRPMPTDPCATFACQWQEEYYGYRCPRCQPFVPFGCAPWAPLPEDGWMLTGEEEESADED